MADVSYKRACPSCSSKNLYTLQTDANGGYGPTLLPKLGKMFKQAKFQVFLCGRCGHVSFFASEESLERLDRSGLSKWKEV